MLASSETLAKCSEIFPDQEDPEHSFANVPEITLFFFFNRASGQQSSTSTAVGTLIDQLIGSRPSLHSVLQNYYEKYQTKGDISWTLELLWNAFSAMIHQLDDCARIYIVLDALDECSDDLEGGFVRCLLSLIQDAGIQAKLRVIPKIMITSRQEQVMDIISPTQHLEITMRDTKGDVEALIAKSVEEIKSRRSLNNTVAYTISDFLHAHADGMFLWVELVMKELMTRDRPLTNETIASKLRVLPTTLASIYEQILQDTPHSRREEFWKILRWLIYGKGKLGVKQLKDLLCWELGIKQWHDFTGDLTFICRSLIRIEADTIFLVHQTARDFLIGYIGVNRAVSENTGGIEMTCRYAEEHLAQVCVNRLLHQGNLQLIWRKFRSMRMHEWATEIRRLSLVDPALIFEADLWAAHLSQVGNPGSILFSQTLELLDSQPKRDALVYLYFCLKYAAAPRGIPSRASRLHIACYFDLPWLVDYCLEQHDNFHAVGDARDTTMVWGSEMGSFDCVKKLLDAGADPNKLESDGWSALHWAAAKNHADICRLLLDFGANAEARDTQGNSSLDWAFHRNNDIIVKMMSETVQSDPSLNVDCKAIKRDPSQDDIHSGSSWATSFCHRPAGD